MFKEITSISKNYALVKLSGNVNEDILNFNVIFEEPNKKILGEIEEIIDDKVRITFLGEFIDNRFYSGIIRKPSLASVVRLINQQELNELVGANDKCSMKLGLSPLYNNYPIRINIDSMFSNHSAIFGNTGSGKTYGVARLVQNLFTMKDKIPFNSNFFIFNNTSEYDNAFKSINNFNVNFNYKLYSTNEENGSNMIKLPLWLLNVDDYANLLDATEYTQISVIEKMLSLVSVFARNDEESHRYKNHLLAKAILGIMYSNQLPARVRDQIFTIMEDCHTEELNLDFEVPGVGYTRQFRKCFELDSQGQFVERILIVGYIEQFIDNNTKWNEDYRPVFFTLDDLEIALNFALISEGLLLNEKSYAEGTALKVKLHTLNNSSYSKFFNYLNFCNTAQFISDIILVNENKRAQIINFVLEDVDDRFAKAVVKVYSRILFRFTKSMTNRGSMPIHIMLEEAHRYVQKDLDNSILGYNIFERITKEGRKYGLLLGIVSQRPSELSETTISQCSNFLVFKMFHPRDLQFIKDIISSADVTLTNKIKTLHPGTCIMFGTAFKLPTIAILDKPNPEPLSQSCDINKTWYLNNN